MQRKAALRVRLKRELRRAGFGNVHAWAGMTTRDLVALVGLVRRTNRGTARTEQSRQPGR